MFDLWKDELTEEETEALLDKAAFEISRRKMNLPAILLFEMHKPLSFVGANAAVAFSPFLVPILGYDAVNDYSRLFASRENVEKLLVRLERSNHTSPPEDACKDS